jgi:DNA-directed RNA polymerase subunit M/transcription elongation factor TFIIS
MPLDFCPVCENYLYLDTSNDKLTKSCKTCGYKKDGEEGGLITETIIQAKSSEEYRYVVNEFTKEDPRLPHFKNLKCPNTACATQSGTPNDVIVIKYDQKNLRFVYICNVCNAEWKSGTR